VLNAPSPPNPYGLAINNLCRESGFSLLPQFGKELTLLPQFGKELTLLPQFGKELTLLPRDTGKYFVPLFRRNRVLNAPSPLGKRLRFASLQVHFICLLNRIKEKE